jgi:FkbM family methyltransferase
MKQLIKQFIKFLPIDLTRNQRYDSQTKKVIARVCSENSNCIDIGCHKGEVLDIILKHAPKGHQYGFEPIPDLYENLVKKYAANPNCHFHQVALSETKGSTTFNYVVSNPAYSGIKKRQYDKPNEVDTQITVKMDLLDNLIPADKKIDLIKIDVEGAELQVLKGGVQTILRSRPVIVFEHGLGASEFYGTTPAMIFDLLHDTCNLEISLMENWLKGKPAFDKPAFIRQFEDRTNYYFIAYPKK